MTQPPEESELARLGPVARMMLSVAGQSITAYVQFRALAELLISRGVITREELEAQFNLMRVHELEATIDDWFPADIASHLKLVVMPQVEQGLGTGASAKSAGGPRPSAPKRPIRRRRSA